jgi:hypothetical protein
MVTAIQLKEVFEKKYYRPDWYKVLRENFHVTTLREKPIDISNRIKDNDYNAKAWELGHFNTAKGHLIGIYELEVAENVQLHRNRKSLRNLLSQVYSTDVEAALLVFVQGNKWRFSYVSEITVKNATTGKREKKITDPKRFTYLLGQGERAKTAADRFASIQKSEDLVDGITLKALEDAFSVEKMSKIFFNEYRKQYGYFVAHITGEDENGKKIKNASPFLKSTFNGNHKEARDFVKKMLGRVVFLYFLEKKGWLGVPADKKWGDGDENFLSNLFNHSKEKKAFYSNVLVPLFFTTLNTERKDDNFKIDPSLFTQPGYNKLKIPYLNGGLFEEDEITTQFLVFPEELFANLFTFFDQHNFTVYEDSPDEHTVAVDPEMLGLIFENLLEDNKDKGAFYTPKEIVHYMCRESLIEYLYTKLNLQQTETNKTNIYIYKDVIEKFVLHHEAASIIEYDEAILKALKEVKICDPAIGSGAFPMGLLMEIFHLVEALNDISPDVTAKVWGLKKRWDPAKVKEEIIQNSIYGVDIEKGAVDIARLRFWLSLVVDEDSPNPLPNLDYKIVVGNSLLSNFEDEVIDIDWGIHMGKAVEKTKALIKEQELKLYDLQHKQYLYFKQPAVDKRKLQREIRNVKIDILVNQLTLNKLSFQDKNPKLGGFAPIPKEIQKNLENEIKIASFDKTIQQLQILKKSKEAILNFFDWKLDFPEVMNEKVAKRKTGFDIVIGNPPYLRVQGLREKYPTETEFYLKKYESATGRFDLYVLFTEKSYSLLNHSGVLNFIQPDKWINSDFGSGLRKLFSKHVSKLISFGQNQVFNVSTYSSLIWITYSNTDKLEYFQLDQELENEEKIGNFLKKLKEDQFDIQDTKLLSSEPWTLLNRNSSVIIQRINKMPLRLEHVLSNISQGVVSVGDDIFIMEGETKNGVFLGYSNKIKGKVEIEAALMKPLLRGEDVKKYEPLSPSVFIIYPHHKVKDKTVPYEEDELKNKFPKAYSYFLPFRKELIEKKIRYKTNPKYWYSLHRSREMSLFEQEKIITPEISLGTNMTFDGKKLYHNTKCYSLVIGELFKDYSIKGLLGILNSKLMWYFLSNTGYVLRGGFFTFKTQYLEHFPIPDLRLYKKQNDFINIVDKAINEKNNNVTSDTLNLEKQIDFIVYALYDLTWEEACIVEDNNEWMSKEGYMKLKNG